MSPSNNQKKIAKRPIVCCESESIPPSAHSHSPLNNHIQTPKMNNTTNNYDMGQSSKIRKEIDFADGENEPPFLVAQFEHAVEPQPSDTSTYDRVVARLEETLLEVRNLFAAHDKLVGAEEDQLYPALRMDAPKKRAYEARPQPPAKKRSTIMGTAANPINPVGIIIITVKSEDNGDEGVEFPMTPTTIFARVYREYGYLINAETDDFVIKKGIRVIDEYKTPEQAMVRHGDILIADGMDPNLNTNTHNRTITFHQTKDGPRRQMTRTLPVLTRIVDLYRTWGDFIGYNTITFDLVHNQATKVRKSEHSWNEEWLRRLLCSSPPTCGFHWVPNRAAFELSKVDQVRCM